MHGTLKYLLMLLLCCSSFTFGQSSDSVSAPPKFMLGVSLLYYHPNLDDFNKGFSLKDQNLTPRWNNFKISYLVLPTVVYRFNRKTQIALLAGGSYLEHARGENKSYYLFWMAGGEYRHIPLSFSSLHFPATVSVALGGGMVGTKFHRSYENDVALNESASSFYINGGATLGIEVLKRMSVTIDARYMFVPKKKLNNLNSDLSLKSVMAGVGLFYAL